jgi:hypothetical protein
MSRWTHGLSVIMQKTLLGISPGKVFFFVEICDYFVDIIPDIGYNKDVERR